MTPYNIPEISKINDFSKISHDFLHNTPRSSSFAGIFYLLRPRCWEIVSLNGITTDALPSLSSIVLLYLKPVLFVIAEPSMYKWLLDRSSLSMYGSNGVARMPHLAHSSFHASYACHLLRRLSTTSSNARNLKLRRRRNPS